MRKTGGKWIKTAALGLAVCLAWMSTVGAGTSAPAADASPAEKTETASAAEASTAETPAVETAIPYWEDDSTAMASIIEYVVSVTDENSPDYKEPKARIAVFDVDGTLFGELFPTYVDTCMMMHRILHDDTYEEPDPEDKEYVEALEKALFSGEPEPDYDKSGGQIIAEAFKGLTIDEYRQYVRAFMAEPAAGFDGMCYGDGFYKPMTALVQYLAAHDFQIYICSGGERTFLRELTEGTLDDWIPPQQVIGTTFSLTATGQGDKAGRSYTYTADDEVLIEGNMSFKNQKMNKVASIVQEIGVTPILAFGNSSGDFAMAQYIVQHGGKAYMLLCDDTERDYGNTEKAAEFAQECAELGFETVSMKNEFTTIYGENVQKTSFSAPEPAKEPTQAPEDPEEEALKPAA